MSGGRKLTETRGDGMSSPRVSAESSVSGAAHEFRIQQIQAPGVFAEKVESGNEVAGLFFFLALFGDEPFQKLAGTEVVGITGFPVKSVNERGDALFVSESGGKGFPVIRETCDRSRDGSKFHDYPVVQKIVQNFPGMVLFFPGLYVEPVAESVQTSALIESGNGQIKVGGIEFLVELFLQQCA